MRQGQSENEATAERNEEKEELKYGRMAENKKRKKEKKQGRIHGYPIRVWVGRGSEIDQPSSWEGAVTQKLPINAKKAKREGPTDQTTN